VSPAESTPNHSPSRVDETALTPSSLPPLPPSPTSPAKSIIQKTADVAAKVQEINPRDIIQGGQESLLTARQVRSANISPVLVSSPSSTCQIRVTFCLLPPCLNSYTSCILLFRGKPPR
jgi:hypothetical protein